MHIIPLSAMLSTGITGHSAIRIMSILLWASIACLLALTGILMGQKRRQANLEQTLSRETTRRLDEAARYNAILGHSSEGFWIMDPETLILTEVNQGLCLMLGRDKSDLLGRPCFHLFPPEEREESLAKLRQAEKAAFRVEVQLLRADGMTLPVQLAPVRIHPRDGIDYQLTFVTNLALIKEQEHTLRLFCRAIEQSGIAIIITDSQGKIEYVNHRFTQITGYTQEEALGQTPRILKSGEHPLSFMRPCGPRSSLENVGRGPLSTKERTANCTGKR